MGLSHHLNDKRIVAVLGSLLVAAVGGVDYLTGPDYALSVFYLIPVILAAWYGGRFTAVVISVLAALSWLAAELAGRKYLVNPSVLYWNDFMELVFFLVVSFTLSALKSSLEQEKLTARTDHLTGIPNRRYFHDVAELEMNVNRRYQHPFTVVYIDIDNFKEVNDTLGHSGGDLLLRLVSATIRDSLRTSDIVTRLGGDEFGLLLPETGSEAARVTLRKVRESLEVAVQGRWPVTFSIGMVTYYKSPSTVDDLIKKADGLMYTVKNEGKGMLRHEVVDGVEPEQSEQVL